MSARTLQPQDQIAHYRIVGPLGAGGMGEVYLAQDQTLERSVALKILPPELVRSEERVRRFVREAKSASSLNHPNIVTIYEIGQDEVRAPDRAPAAEPGSSSVHYISMELVSGETLTTKIHHDKTDLKTLLGFLAQAAEGLAKAHAAGIVHRDLKPGNIMVSKDGYAKILDFGLAKLTERDAADADLTSAATEGEDGTSAGAVMGTVGYMSPEQVQGKSVDHRSDIFSFGCILYEAVTRKKPFAADSNVETMHRILHDKPAPIEELNKEAPAEVRRLIRRCLAKNPDQRLQSAKDLAIELREIVEEYDSLTPGSSGSGSSALAAAAPAKRRPSPWLLAAAALVIVGGFALGLWVFRRGGETGTDASRAPVRVSTISSRGSIVSCALSPDGRYLAYIEALAAQGSIWVRQVTTGSDVQILPPQKVVPFGVTFTPDGNYLYYLRDDPDKAGYKALYEIPTLGGTPRKRTYDVDSRVTFSPDGKRVCFRRGVPQKKQENLVIFDLEHGQERVLGTVSDPVTFGQPAWSPDGKRVAVVESRGGVALGGSVATYGAENGRREPVGKEAWPEIADLAWLPDGSGLVLSAFDRSTFTAGQLWALAYPSGRSRRITSDTDFYFDLSLSAGGNTMATVRTRREANLWSAAVSGPRSVRQITFGSGGESVVESFDSGQDSTILFDMVKDGSVHVWEIGADGTSQRSITPTGTLAGNPFVRPGAGVFYEQASRDLVSHIWRADERWENPRQLTSGNGERILDVSRDGRSVLFLRNDTPYILWSVSSEGGEPIQLGSNSDNVVTFSPDGRRILHTAIQEVQGQGVFTVQIIPAGGGEPVLTPALPPRAGSLTWTPDGNGLTYTHASNGFMNLFLLPLSAGGPREVTRFTEGRITGHAWSPDGKRILIRRRIGGAGNLWVTGADGSNPTAVTDFETGQISGMKWSRDGSRIYFTYGETTQNVALITNFR